VNSDRQEEILERLPKWMQELLKLEEEAKREKLESEPEPK